MFARWFSRLRPALLLGLALTLPGDALAQQPGSIVGIVREARSEGPVSSVRVYIPALEVGQLTQANGRYLLINVPPGVHTVRVERIGFRSDSREVTVLSGQPVQVDFLLTEDALALDEMVVTGTAGQARRREVGNTVSQVRPADVEEPVMSVGALLQGRMPGVRVADGAGNSGSAPDIRLRGNVSVAMSNQPLIYIDGVRAKSEPYPFNSGATGRGIGGGADVPSPLADLNPDDIERIEIVKGPAATTLYGTEAAAGVIQIFTKSGGGGGAAAWSLEMRQGYSSLRAFGPDLPLLDGMVEDGTTAFMFMDPVLRKGHRQSYNLSVRGGAADRLGYFISAGWDDNEGAVMNDYERQLALRGNTQFQASEDVLIQFNNSFSKTELSQIHHGNTGSGIVMTGYRGTDSYIGDRSATAMKILVEQRNYTYISRYVNGLTINYSPSPRFTQRLTLGHDFSQFDGERLFDYCWRCPFGRTNDFGSVGRTSNQNTLRSLDYVGNLVFELTQSVRNTFSYGMQGVENTEETVWAQGNDLPGPGDYTVTSAANREGYQQKIRVITGGFFLQDMIALSDRYFLTLGLRIDGNSAFGSGFGMQPYPKVSFSYVLSDEGFWPTSAGSVKLRAAWGLAGRAPGAFDAVRTWDPIGWGAGTAAFQPQNLGNPELGPERTSEVETGFDGVFLGNRMNVEYTYYAQTTYDALFPIARPLSEGGWSSQVFNVGEFQNRGHELSLTGNVIEGRSFRWNAGFGYSTNHSKVVDLGGAPPSASLEVGQPVPAVRGHVIDNFYEKADPIIRTNQFIGPSYPTQIINLNSSFTLPGGISLSGRGEYQSGHFIGNGAESNALTRGIQVPKCYDAYRKRAAGQNAELLAWERAQCFGMSSGLLNIVPADLFELRDITLSIPVSALLPSLTGWSNRTDLTISGRNLWFKKDKKLVTGHPEQRERTGIGAGRFPLAGGNIGETLPAFSYFTVSLRAAF